MLAATSMTVASSRKFSLSIVALVGGLSLSCGPAGIAGARAESAPDSENGRYALLSVLDGIIRLDTRSGSVSNCSDTGTGWACYAVPDERDALDAEIGRLQSENEKLKAQLAAGEPTVSGKIDEPLPKADSLKPPAPKVAEGGSRVEIPLPGNRDMGRVMSFLEQAWRRLVEMASRVQKDISGRI